MGISLEGIKTETGKFFIPAKALGDVFVDTTEKLVTLQMESSKAYTDIAFSQLKKMPHIHNLEEAGDFFWGQIEPVSEVNKQLLNDWKSMMALNTEWSDSIKSVFSNKPPEKTAKAKPTRKVDSIVAPEEEKEKTEEPVTKISKGKRTARSPSARKTSTSS